MTAQLPLSLTSTVVVTSDHLTAEVAGETVIMDNVSGYYFGLNPLSSHIWSLMQSPQTVHDLCEAVMAQYEVERDQCEQDVLELLRELAAQGLIEIREGLG